MNAQIEGGTVDANVGVGFAISSRDRGARRPPVDRSPGAPSRLARRRGRDDRSNPGADRAGPARDGAVVARVVKGSPAAKAGIAAANRQVTVNGVSGLLGGDTVVGIDGTSVTTSDQLADAVAQHKPGDKLKLEVVRGGKTRTVTVTLGNAPAGQA